MYIHASIGHIHGPKMGPTWAHELAQMGAIRANDGPIMDPEGPKCSRIDTYRHMHLTNITCGRMTPQQMIDMYNININLSLCVVAWY
jgi:hypothetical protein